MANPRAKLMEAILKPAFVACNLVAMVAAAPILFAQVPAATPSTTQNVQQILEQVHSSVSPNAVTPSTIGVTPEGLAKLKLTPGSMISLHVFEETDFDGNYRLDNQGNISIPMVGTVSIGALSLHEAEGAISSKFVAAGVLTESHVVVNLVDFAAQYVAVSGEVNEPGRFPVIAPRTLGDLIATAGGLTVAAGNEIVISRASESGQSPEIVHYKRNQSDHSMLNVMVNPGDSVYVKRAGIVYVLGAVYRPGGFIMPDDGGGVNVAEALSLASGTSPEAAMNNIRILRKAPDGTWSTFVVRMDKIQKGKATPPQLLAEDIVYVPPSVLKEAAIDVKSIAGGVGQAAVYRIP